MLIIIKSVISIAHRKYPTERMLSLWTSNQIALKRFCCLPMKGAQHTQVWSVLNLQVSLSLSPSLRDRQSSREVDYTNFYSELLPLVVHNNNLSFGGTWNILWGMVIRNEMLCYMMSNRQGKSMTVSEFWRQASLALTCTLSNTRILMSMGQSPWDDIKVLGHCSVSFCLYVCLCVLNGTISKFWAVPCSSKCVYSPDCCATLWSSLVSGAAAGVDGDMAIPADLPDSWNGNHISDLLCLKDQSPWRNLTLTSQTIRDMKLAFDIHIAMYLVYVPSKDQLPSATRFELRDTSRKRPQIHLCTSGLFWRESFSRKYAPWPCIFDAIHAHILGSW